MLNIRAFILSVAAIVFASADILVAQNPLFIPPTLSGTTFNLNMQSGSTQFFTGINTPTYGVNGALLAPTLIVNKGDSVTLNVTNNLPGTTATTMHWHGLHVPAKDDGGPHQIISNGSTWSPSFRIMNDAATYWYHPHGANQTDLQVSKGIAGMIIVKDNIEASLTLPRTYGIDDFPLIVQSKAFDILYQIAIATDLDTVMMVNGTMNPYLTAPAQVVRLRLLNASSMRNYDFGFSNNMMFYQIATDGGLLNAPVSLNRVRLVPGERAEILVDFGAMQGQTLFFENFGTELQHGIYGADSVGNAIISIPEYELNPLNGANFNILQINITAPTSNPVTTIPSSLSTVTPLSESDAAITRNFLLAAQDTFDPQELVEGPFTINGHQFSMDTINETVYKNTTEIWNIENQTMIAHPFHIHDVQFFILDENGNIPPPNEQGKKDLVLVMPMQNVRLIMKFEDYTDDSIPYMYHCHMLHHEDDGMMGSFLVRDSSAADIDEVKNENHIELYPNPADEAITISNSLNEDPNDQKITITDLSGKILSVMKFQNPKFQFSTKEFCNGIYLLTLSNNNSSLTLKIIIHHSN